MKIGFAISHGEKISFNKRENFSKITSFLKSAKFDKNTVVNIRNRLSAEVLKDVDVLIIGGPTEQLTPIEIKAVRNFTRNGGHLFVIMKFGGDNLVNSNIRDFFEDVTPNNDELTNFEEYHTIDDAFKYTRPLVHINVDNALFSFQGTICYDGGCTFSVNTDDAITVNPQRNCYSYPNPSYGLLNHPKYNKNRDMPGSFLVIKPCGKGLAVYWGARWSFSDELFDEYDNSRLFKQIFSLLMGKKGYGNELIERMRQPQRHRLLHGFPMSSGMKQISINPRKKSISMPVDLNKELCIGIIPHPLCNPKVPKCGYCTFPYERYDPKKEVSSLYTVVDEIKKFKKRKRFLLNQPVSSLYFGGGTANLTQPQHFHYLCETIAEELNLKNNVEITLEGAPKYFVDHSELLTVMKDIFPNAIHRISLGVQTFDQSILRKMGRSEMNEEGSVEDAIDIARDHGFHVSTDFMFNLPGQNYDDIRSDLERIARLNVEHICWYNLVAYKGLPTPWGRNKKIINSLHSQANRRLAMGFLYSDLLDFGYEPVTVTDFRKTKAKEKGRYQYEEDLRNPETKNWVGFGPSTITLLTNESFTSGIKLMNPKRVIDYIKRQWRYGVPWETSFDYTLEDLKLYWLTRQVKGTKISKEQYATLFHRNLNSDYKTSLTVLCDQGLLEETDQYYSLTRKGFYYADSIAGLLAWLRVAELSSLRKKGTVVKTRHGYRPNYRTYDFDDDDEDEPSYWDNDPRDIFMG